jgi:hypothetical protein
MTVIRGFNRGGAIFCAFILLLAMASERLTHAMEAGSADNAYLDALQGDWDMSGTLLGKPVKYHADECCMADFCDCT